MDLEDKVVFITGASRGIGEATAYGFAKEGCRLVLTYRKDKGEAEKVGKKCLDLGAKDVLLLELDVMDNKNIAEAVKETIKEFGEVAVLVNNAGVSHWMGFREQSFEDIEVELRTNLEGLIKLTREFLGHVTDCVVNISSILGMEAEEKETVYCASKYGVRGFTQALALEEDLRVYSVNPRGTATAMNDFQGDPPEKVAEVILKVAKGKINLKSGSDVNVWKHF